MRRGDCADLFHTADGARAENRDAVAGGLVVTIDHVPHGTAATVPDDSGTRQRVSITQHRIAARVAAKFDPQVPREAESKRAIRGIP